MGKTRSKRCKSKKPCPTGLPSVQDINIEEENLGVASDSSSAVILSITEKLQSPNVEDKECACCNIANLIAEEKDEAIKLIVKNNVIRMLGSLLVDSSAVVRHAASGALRNLSVVGEADICDIMMEEDIMTPLVALLKQYSTEWTPLPSKKKENRIETKSEIFIEATSLLWNLCESSSTAVGIFNSENLLPLLIHCLNPVSHGNEVAIAVGHCLHIVSEDNSELSVQINENPAMYETIKSLLALEDDSGEAHLLRTLSCGILININEGKLSKCPLPLMTSMIPMLSRTLSKNAFASVEELSKLIFQKKSSRKRSENEKETPQIEDKAISSLKSSLENLLASQCVAFEIITNICCSEDSSEDWDDVDSSDASDEIYSDVCMGEDGDVVMEKLQLRITSEVHEAIVSHNLLEMAITKVRPPDLEIMKALKSDSYNGKGVLKRLTTLNCRALLCLHNIVECLDHEELGGAKNIHRCWMNLSSMAFEHTYMCTSQENVNYCDCKEHLEYLEAATSAMRILVQKLAEMNTMFLHEFSQSDLQILYDIVLVASEPSIRNNIINIIGILGSNIPNETNNSVTSPELIQQIGLFLLEICISKEMDLIVIAEALDAIFDVFAEDYTDTIAQEINLVERLRPVLPLFKHRIHQQRQRLGENYPVVMTSKTNLARFIQYKTEQFAKNGHQ